eukprot:CAMPEP_0176128202 /NCGR_PEP_ID=MMETSP0120_2-20121206/64775_1 /TAXON_ID=160619 /ORGANISM="Kryptoperidinium foliaceum, Strain CCMP 1326" /LENGTH=59 /DNA_ID=CAMNT_0017463283 /DNA_START=22 /DNA_END=198 /DNA_ORIENTATION=-
MQCEHIMSMLRTAQGLQLEPVWMSTASARQASEERLASKNRARGILGDGCASCPANFKG